MRLVQCAVVSGRYDPSTADERVVEEIRALSGREFYITDDMIMLNRLRIQRYMIELCEKIRDFKVSMFLSCSPAMNTDPAYLDAIAAAGAKSMYTVFASDPISARFYAGHEGIWQRTIDLVKKLEDRGIRFFGSFGVGFDTCNEDQFDLVLEFCEKASVKTAEFFIATPFPNTPFWNRIQMTTGFLIRLTGANSIARTSCSGRPIPRRSSSQRGLSCCGKSFSRMLTTNRRSGHSNRSLIIFLNHGSFLKMSRMPLRAGSRTIRNSLNGSAGN